MRSDLLRLLAYRFDLNARALGGITEDIEAWIGKYQSTALPTQLSENLELIETNSKIIANVMADIGITGTPRNP